MNILVVNPGSTSLKFKLFNENEVSIKHGSVYSNATGYFLKITDEKTKIEIEISKEDFLNSAELIIEKIEEDIGLVGFRVVHGGEIYINVTKIDSTTVSELEKLSQIAPLHNPPAIAAIKSFLTKMPDVPMYALFDTSFHQSILPKAFLYGLPYEFYEEHKIRKYGFHGISCQYITQRLSEVQPDAIKIIICHLGGGSSVTAVKNSHSVDTSMGFTPLEGVMMATRSGNVDDGVIHYMVENLKLSIGEIKDIENKKSGLLGISGTTEDMRKLLELESNGDKRAKLAIDMYVYKIQKEIGAMAASLNGIDSLVFTAGVGVGSDIIRARICQSLEYLNIAIDEKANNGLIDVDEEVEISSSNSQPIWIIPTNEELQIARNIKNHL